MLAFVLAGPRVGTRILLARWRAGAWHEILGLKKRSNFSNFGALLAIFWPLFGISVRLESFWAILDRFGSFWQFVP